MTMASQAVLEEAASLLASIGVQGLCHQTSDDFNPFFPRCNDILLLEQEEDTSRFLHAVGPQDDWFYIKNGLLAFTCVVVAALAAGLTMGLMSLDPLMLTIKMRASTNEDERRQASTLLPIVQKHHLLLVTLLLLNSLANEALPLFMDSLVPSYLAVLLSVTLVLLFGEILPSAVFTGPNQMRLASRLVPLVKLVMLLLLPISYPIAKLLDCLLHDENEMGSMFNRGELTALVRIQYEESMAAKSCHRAERKQFEEGQMLSKSLLEASVRNAKCEYERNEQTSHSSTTEASSPPNRLDYQWSPSIHVDEVLMVTGALSMKTKCAIDVYTPLRKLYAIPYDTVLDERTVVCIYSSGYSRIPVYDRNSEKPKDITAIRGILMTKQLIVINKSDRRPVSTLPLSTPVCVSAKKNLVDLINMFQTGIGGHMALVCTRPDVGNKALQQGEALPASAGLIGCITLEDCLEMLLQEQILDETDKLERGERRLVQWVMSRWKLFVNQQKADRDDAQLHKDPKMLNIVNQAMTQTVTDETPLLGAPEEENEDKRRVSFLPFLK